jgi:phosphoglycerate dehydrogenase-like enzyme
MTKVLVTEPLPPAVVAQVQAMLPPGVACTAVPDPTDEAFAAQVADADVLLVIHRKIDAGTFALAPKLRFVQRCGLGYDNIDLAAAKGAGVPVAFTPGANAAAVAEHTILLMLALVKQFLPAEQVVRTGGWWTTGEVVQRGITDLAGATIGLVGLGSIGRAVALRLGAFGSRLRYTTRHRADSAIEAQLGLEYLGLPELLGASTIVSLHLPLTLESHGLIGDAQLAMMPAGSYLVNTSRGGLVVESALRRAIERGHLAGAALDVLEHEVGGGNPFTDLAPVIVTPHMAGASRGGAGRILQVAAANVARFLAGESPIDLAPTS